MRSLDVATTTALADPALVPRNFVVITTKNRSTGAAIVRGLWDDAEAVTVNVLDPETGSTVSRAFVGDGAIQRMDPVPMRIGLEVRTLQIELSAIHSEVQQIVRGDDPRNAKVEIYRGLLSPATMLLVAVPRIRFLGYVNEAPIETAAAGGESTALLRCVSTTRELTKTNPLRKSDEQQKQRSGDRFRRYTGIAAEWPIWWGEDKGAAD